MPAIYHSYIDAAFLKNHRKNKPMASSDEFVESDEMKNWRAINEFLLLRTRITLFKQGIDAKDLQDANPLAFALLNDYMQGKRKDMTFIEKSDEQLVNCRNVLSLFFFTDEVKLGFSPAAYGFIKYDSGKVQKRWLDNPCKPRELLISGEQLVNNQLQSWNDFSQFGLGTNSIVILDNYIFNNKFSVANNFVPLIRAFYPASLSDSPLDILVITKYLYAKNPDSLRTEHQEESLKNVYDLIEKELVKGLTSRSFTLTIIQKKRALNNVHDRNIITNYLRIKVSNSLSFFDRKGRALMASDVTFDPLPHIARNGDETHGDISLVFLKRASEILNDQTNMVLGVSKNRLLDVYERS